MDLQHFNVKLFVEGELAIDPEVLIAVFHDWIRQGKLDGLLIDVADYRHVHEGPGVMLIAHEANYNLDHGGGRWGLRYNCKKALEGSNARRLRSALRAAARACQLLEEEDFDGGSAMRFDRNELEVAVADRALAPNSPATYDAVSAEIAEVLAEALGGACELRHCGEPRDFFRVHVKTAASFDLAAVAALS